MGGVVDDGGGVVVIVIGFRVVGLGAGVGVDRPERRRTRAQVGRLAHVVDVQVGRRRIGRPGAAQIGRVAHVVDVDVGRRRIGGVGTAAVAGRAAIGLVVDAAGRAGADAAVVVSATESMAWWRRVRRWSWSAADAVAARPEDVPPDRSPGWRCAVDALMMTLA
jgi:hypothetical protein